MKYPQMSIVIATYNSERTLPEVLESIGRQSYPRKKIEILVIDGESTDATLSIAREYKCRILKNSKVDQVFAKHMGYKAAKGKFMLLLDSDEVLENINSIEDKASSMLMNDRVKAVISSGLKKPSSYPQINYYLNEFGDPFSYFMYRNSKDPKFFLKELKSKYEKVYEDKDRIVFDFSRLNDPPFIELTAMGVMVNLRYIKSTFPSVLKNVPDHTHLFYFLNSKSNLFAVMKHDEILHYSVATLGSYLRKIRSRIKSNIYNTSMGFAGFKGREKYHSAWYRFKKFLFVPYSISLVLPFVDSIYLSISRKKPIYLIHTFLCLYTVLLIIFYYVLRILGIRTKLYGYGS